MPMTDNKHHILVVDDDDRVRFTLGHTLMRLGDDYAVETVRNGCEALDRFEQAAFDVVVTDLIMPDMGGVALTEALKERFPDVAVIWVTAHGCHRFSAEAARLAIFECLEKPLRIAEIREIVLRALEDTA